MAGGPTGSIGPMSAAEDQPTARPGAEVRPLERAEVADAARALARAFEGDPALVSLFADPARRARALRAFLTVPVADALDHGYADALLVGGAVAGAAVWFPPGAYPFGLCAGNCGRSRGCSPWPPPRRGSSGGSGASARTSTRRSRRTAPGTCAWSASSPRRRGAASAPACCGRGSSAATRPAGTATSRPTRRRRRGCTSAWGSRRSRRAPGCCPAGRRTSACAGPRRAA